MNQSTRGSRYPLPLPDYAVDLLMVAKLVIAHERLSGSGDEKLGMAVERFENNMPLTPDGSIFQIGAIDGRTGDD
jgi:hypothetical protein